MPESDEPPENRFGFLLDWYREWFARRQKETRANDPLLARVESGKHLWRGEDPDEYVRGLREGWE